MSLSVFVLPGQFLSSINVLPGQGLSSGLQNMQARSCPSSTLIPYPISCLPFSSLLESATHKHIATHIPHEFQPTGEMSDRFQNGPKLYSHGCLGWIVSRWCVKRKWLSWYVFWKLKGLFGSPSLSKLMSREGMEPEGRGWSLRQDSFSLGDMTGFWEGNLPVFPILPSLYSPPPSSRPQLVLISQNQRRSFQRTGLIWLYFNFFSSVNFVSTPIFTISLESFILFYFNVQEKKWNGKLICLFPKTILNYGHVTGFSHLFLKRQYNPPKSFAIRFMCNLLEGE